LAEKPRSLILSLPNEFQYKEECLCFERAASLVSQGVYLRFHNNLQYLYINHLMLHNQVNNLFGVGCNCFELVSYLMNPFLLPVVRPGIR